MDALRVSEEKYRSLVDTSPDIIWEIDLAGIIRYVNPIITTVTGYTPEDLAGKRIT
ncbi:MAG: PAS domain S-box protein, partial [Methanomicrobiales archaeon]|nr:PAS domain S-box protein [Methanomicrobiales archaeon]